jgi:hypothetical protein
MLTDRERLLLGAALCPDPDVAIAHWKDWSGQIALEEAPYPELRLLTAVYANLSRIARDFRLPDKLRGKARATFIENHLLAQESVPTIAALSERCPVLIAKGLAMCIRHDAWSSRMMGDADVHVPYSSLATAADILARNGWTPHYGMTWESLVHRSALRRSSWNFSRGTACLDLHWRPQPETRDEIITQRMWATAVPHDCLGRTLQLQSAEYALATSLAHGFKIGTHADKLQTIIDAAMLLPACRREVLEPLVDALDLRSPLRSVVSSLEEAGRLDRASPAAGSTVRRMRGQDEHETALRAPATGFTPAPERALLRRPGLYRLWEATGRKARIERALLRWAGPFSQPPQRSGTFREDYDLRDCAVMDQIGGPGWGWPEPGGFWSDRADARLLVPLRGFEDYMVAIDLADSRVTTPNFRINVFANGHFMTTMDLRHDATTSQYCFLVSRTILTGPWVEFSLRPHPYLGPRHIAPETYGLMRGAPVTRLQVLDVRATRWVLGRDQIAELHMRILRGAEPEASRYNRIRDRIESSVHRASKALPDDFDPVLYVLANRDLFDAEVDPYEHFVTLGRAQGRRWR